MKKGKTLNVLEKPNHPYTKGLLDCLFKLEDEQKKNQIKDTMMGWNGGSNTVSQIELKFSSRKEAINYAKKNRIEYEVLETSERKVINKSYADNFK